MNLIRTKRTYKTPEAAEKALEKVLSKVIDVHAPMTLASVRYLIAVAEDGRFAPVLVGNQYIPFAVNSHITVVS